MVKIRVLSIKFFLVTIQLIILQSVFAQGGSKSNKTWTQVDSLNELAENEWTQGDRSKKMKSKKMKEQILRIRTNSMLDQQISFNDFFEQWRGNNEQLDDVCVIGLKI